MSAAAPREGASGGAAAFPWAEAMGFAFGRLALSPRDFWTMTPRELAAALAPFAGAAGGAPPRAALDALIARFPDRRR